MRAGFLIVVASSVVLAGCVASEGTLPASETDVVELIEAGRVQGTVTDDSLMPLESVKVILDDDRTTSSGVDGSFEFVEVALGEHVVAFNKPGFFPTTAKVDVIADEAAIVRMTLISAAVDSSFHETMSANGILFCGMSTHDPVWHPTNNSARGNPCVLMTQAGMEDADRAQIRWFFKFTDSSGFWSETVWTASSGFNKAMGIVWTPLGDDGASTPGLQGGGWGDAVASPMRIRVPIKMVEDRLKNFTTESCKLDECMLLSYHYVGGEILGAGYPVDAGVGFQQRYEVWVTVFYNGPLPEEFTIFPE